MSEKRASRGARVPAPWQLLLIVGAVCVGWLTWSDLREPASDPRADGRGAEDPVAAALDHLHAVEAIAQNGPDGLPLLIAELENSNLRMRRNALLALRQVSPDALDALGPVRERFFDDDAATRKYAIDAYWHIRRDPRDVAKAVAFMLGDQVPEVRANAEKVLETIGPPAVEPLLDLLRGDPAAARIPALQLLRRIGWDPPRNEAEAVVRKLAGNANAEVRLEALLTLAACGAPTSAEIRELLKEKFPAESVQKNPWWGTFEVREPSNGPLAAALNAIVRMGPAAADNLADLLPLLSDERGAPRPLRGVLAALCSMRSAALPAAPRLIQIFDETEDRSRLEIAWTLFKIGAEPHEISRIVTPLLMNQDGEYCFCAGRLCAQIDPNEAHRQVSALIPKLAADDPASRLPVLNAICGLAPVAQEAVPTLARLLESPDHNVPSTAARALGDIGPAAAAAVPAMLGVLHRDPPILDYWARDAIFQALGKIGPAARNAMPELLEEVNALAELKGLHFIYNNTRPIRSDRSDRGPCISAIAALERVGGADPVVVSALRRLLSSETLGMRSAALESLFRLAPDSPEVLGELLNRLDGGYEAADVESILKIGLLRADRHKAVKALIDALDANNAEIKKATAWTLGKIGPEAKAALPTLLELLTDWENSFHVPRRWANLPGYARLEDGIERWRYSGDSDPPLLLGGAEHRRLQIMSVDEAVREAIGAIDPAALP